MREQHNSTGSGISPQGLRETGIEAVGGAPWGTHFCHFYETKADLLDILVPYFKAGLASNEFCMWVVFDPLNEAGAREVLRQNISGADQHFATGDIEILPYSQWYLKDGTLDVPRVINGWKEKLAQALADGYDGMRVNGNEAWLTEKDWKDFLEYEKELNHVVVNQRMIVLCTYPLAMSRAAAVFDVARTHEFAIAKRHGNWEVLETPELRQAKAQIRKLNELLEQRVAERTRQLATANEDLRKEIARHELAKETLQESEQRFTAFMENMPGYAWIKDLDGRFVYLSPACAQVSFHPLDWRGKTDDDLWPAEMAANYKANDQKVIASRKAVLTVEPYMSEGKQRYVIVSKFPILDKNGTVALVGGVSVDITERLKAEEAVREHAKRLQMLSRRLVDAQETERRRVAQELHDEVGHALTVLNLTLSECLRLSPAVPTEPLSKALQTLDELANRVRNVSLMLRPSMLDDLGLLPALVWQCDTFGQQTGIQIDFSHAGLEGRRFAPEIETAAYRVVQEALTNVARHASVPVAFVKVWVEPKLLHVQIEDRGRGFDPVAALASHACIGLVGMRARAEAVGGRLNFESSPGAGTYVHAEFPVSEPT